MTATAYGRRIDGVVERGGGRNYELLIMRDEGGEEVRR